MARLLEALIRNGVFANLMVAFMVAVGVAGMLSMRREGFPPIPMDMVTVGIVYPGAGPEEVEESIALKLEEVLQGIAGVKRLQVSAGEGVCSALIECNTGADMVQVKADVEQNLNAVRTFPVDSERPIVRILRNESNVLQVSVWGEGGEKLLRDLALDMRDDLLRIPDVSGAALLGAREPEIAIECSEERLRQYGLSFEALARAVQAHSFNLPAGDLKLRGGALHIRARGRSTNAREFAAIPVRADASGAVLRLGDVADVRDGFAEEGARGRLNGHPCVSLVIEKGEEGDTITIARAIRDLAGRWRARLPEGVEITLWQDMSPLIQGRIDLLLRNGLQGFTLVVLILGLFMSFRTSLWVALGVPFALLGGIGIIAACGQSINMINLFGMIMVVGILVDGAIVVGGAVDVQRQNGKPPLRAVIDGTLEVLWPVVASVTTTIVAFMPLFFVSGLMGKFIGIMPGIVVAALTVSLLEALFLLPVHLYECSPPADAAPSRVRRSLGQLPQAMAAFGVAAGTRYRQIVAGLIRHRYATAAASLLLLLWCVGLMQGGFIKFVFFPEIDADYILASVEFPEGTPVETTERALVQMEQAWREVDRARRGTLPELTRALYAGVGVITESDRRTRRGDHLGQIVLELVPAETRRIYHKDLLDQWRQRIGTIPGAERFNIGSVEHGPGGKDVELWLLSNDEGLRREGAETLKAFLASRVGVSEVESSDGPGKKEISVRLKPEAAHDGVTLAAVAGQLRSAFQGFEAQRIQRGRDEVKVKVRYSAPERGELDTLREMRVRLPGGLEVPLLSVAEVEPTRGPAVIDRYLGRRKTTVTASVDDRIVTSGEITAALRQDLIPALERRGLSVLLQGQADEMRQSMRSLFIGLALSLLANYIIIATTFRSYLQPLVIMAVIPFGMVGALLGHLFFGLPLSMFSLFGIVATTGIVVNDAIVMVECINSHLQQGLPFMTALVESGLRRLRPIFLTTITTVAGLAPIIFEKSMQAQVLIPMAISIAAGVAGFSKSGSVPSCA